MGEVIEELPCWFGVKEERLGGQTGGVLEDFFVLDGECVGGVGGGARNGFVE